MQKNILFIILFTCLLTGCSTEYSAVYQRADAENKWDESASITVNNSKDEPPLFVVVENRLYLMIRMTRVDWFFRTVITYPSWSSADMARFIENNPGIKPLVPLDWNDWLPRDYGKECIPGESKKEN